MPAAVLLALGTAVAGAALWTRTPRVGYLIGAAGATVLAALLATRGGRRFASLWTLLGAHVALACWVALAAGGQRELSRTRINGEQAVLAQAEVDARRVAAAIDQARERLVATLTGLPTDVTLSAPPVLRDAETSLARVDGDRVVASRGPWRVPIPRTDALREGQTEQLVMTPLYRALVVSIRQGAQVRHGSVLVQALPPVDRFARDLVTGVVGGSDAGRITVGSPSAMAGFSGGDAAAAMSGTTVVIAARIPTPAAAELLVVERSRLRTLPVLAMALLLVGATVGRRPTTLARRLAVVALAIAAVGVVPLSTLSNVSPLMDASVFFVRAGGSWTANLAALGLTGALLVLALCVLSRARPRLPRLAALPLIAVLAVLGPFVIRELSRGITPPPDAVPTALWVAWQLALALAALALVLAIMLVARAAQPALTWRVAPLLVIGLAVGLAAGAPLFWRVPAGWPDWYTVPWIAVLLSCAAIASRPRAVLHAAIVAGSAAAMLVWGATARRAVELAERDVGRLAQIDEDAARLLERLGWGLLQQPLPADADGLLAAYGASDLASAGFRATLQAWRLDGGGAPVASVRTSPLDAPATTLQALADRARIERVPLLVSVDIDRATLLTLAVADSLGTAITITVAPRTQTGRPVGVATLLGAGASTDARAPYQVTLTSVAASAGVVLNQPVWSRQDSRVVGDWLARIGPAIAQVHAEVDLRSWDALLTRGILLVAFNVLVALALWGLVMSADGAVARWLRWRWAGMSRSYRARLTVMLSLFFALPVGCFALWTATRARDDDRQARAVLARESLRTVDGTAPLTDDGMPRFVYRDRQLVAASDPVLLAAAPFGRVLDDAIVDGLLQQRRPDAELTIVQTDPRAPASVLAYRAVAPAASVVALAPAVRDDGVVAQRRDDLLFVVLAAALLGVLAAAWLGGQVARQLERPVDALRTAVLSLPAPSRAPGKVPAEFVPAFEAVERTGRALTESRDALEAARRRTDAVLRNVASAVLAVDGGGALLLMNPRAEALFPAAGAGDQPAWPPLLAERVQQGLGMAADDPRLDEPFGLDLGDRQWQVRLSRLAAGGVVVTLDDVTDRARAERVIAWGEMARQVAHEIKNPLTPVRLGIQHVRRAWRDGRGDFGTLLETNVDRILVEIDHLDQIARQFSRFGAPADANGPSPLDGPLETVDARAVADQVLRLERMGASAVRWHIDAPEQPLLVQARRGELHEVLLNLCENARLAEARTVTVAIAPAPGGLIAIRVVDDGVGIPAEHLARIFEPRFSTRTSGTGLGLAICRRLVTSWGGSIDVESVAGQGTTMRVLLRPAGDRAEAAGV